jgi:hypothetical protein
MRSEALPALALVVVGSLVSGCGGGAAGRVLHTRASFVLVGAEDDADAPAAGVGFGGYVAMLGRCVGIGDATVIWPYGTEITSDRPLTIAVPGLGTLQVGDPASGGAVDYGDHLPKGIDVIPSGCPTERVIAFYPDR